MKKIILSSVVLLVLTLFQSALAQTVRVGRACLASDAGVYIAMEKGFFKQSGFDVGLSPCMPAGEQMSVLATGQLEIATGGVNPGLFNAVARGMPIVVVADKGSFLPGWGYGAVVVRKELWDAGEVRAIKDLKGRPIATNAPSSPNVYMWAKTLQKEGLGLSDIDLKSVPFPMMATALATKAIDAANPMEPHVSRAVELKVGVVLTTLDKVIPNMQVAVIFYSREFGDKRAEMAKRWMVDYLRGVRFYNEAVKEGGSKLEELIQILIKHTGVKERKLYDKVVWAGINPEGLVNRESLADQQNFYNQAGWVPKTTRVEQFVDDTFVRHAVQVLGSYRP